MPTNNHAPVITFGTPYFPLANLDGNNGFAIAGINMFDGSGRPVSDAGDLNGDGFDDLIIGATYADPSGNSNAGESYVVFGSDSGFASSFNLSSLDGSNGFVVHGIDAYDSLGYSVSGAGDVNGDGFDDLIIGARGADPNGNSSAGESYVVFGSDSGFSAAFDLSSLDGSNGFVVHGIDAYDSLGHSVSGAGDVNGDGFDDLSIGTFFYSTGQSYVVFGRDSGFGSSFNLASLDGNNGFIIDGIEQSDFSNSSSSVSSAGDINGDGLDDLIIGVAFSSDRLGKSYVVFGRNSGFGPSFNLSSLDGSNGFVLNEITLGDFASYSISGAGDVNGDGFDDLIIGAYGADDYSGESYVVFGRDSGFGPSFNLSSLNGSNGFVLRGIRDRGGFGFSVSNAGDVNSDGFSDLIIGAPNIEAPPDNIGAPNPAREAGESYVVFGNDSGFGASFDLSSLNGNNGFILKGREEGDFSGGSVSSAGDVNGDGFDDLIIGADAATLNGIGSGESYVVFGRDTYGPSIVGTTVQENTMEVGIITAQDANGDTLSFSLTDGADQSLFIIDPTTGLLSFQTAPDFEAPTDSNLDNIYEVEVTVNDGNGSTATRTILVTVQNLFENGDPPSVVIDHYIVGATVFLDASGDGQLNYDEPFTQTDGSGLYQLNIPAIFDWNNDGQLNPDEGLLIAFDGIDTATGLPLTTPIVATPDFTVLTLLSNLVADLVVNQGLTSEVAQTQVKTALGIPATFDLSQTDPIAATTTNQSGGVETFSGMVQVQNVVTQIAGLIDGASSIARATLVNNVIGSITSQIQLGTTLNLTDTTLLQTLIENSASNTGSNLSHLSAQAATVIAAANQKIVDAMTNLTPSALEVAFAKVQKVALGKTTQDLEQVGAGTKSIADVVAENTGTTLDTQINNAQVFSTDPTDLSLSNANIPTGQQPIGTEIGTFATVDPDVGETHTYQLVLGAGDTDNDQFEIVGDRLLTKTVLDPTQGNYHIRVLSSDGNGGTYAKSLSLDQNRAPSIGPSNVSLTVLENSTTVTTLTATDLDGDDPTFSLAGDDDQSQFTLDATTGALTFQTTPNYEAPTDSDGDNLYQVEVKVEDGNGGSDTQTITITIQDLDDTPNEVGLSNNAVLESATIGSNIGRLYTIDPDTTDGHTYSLVAGTGDTDNGNFSINGNQLYTNATLDFETQSSHSIRVQTQDSDGNRFEQTLTINVTDVNETPVTGGDGVINGTADRDFLYGADNDDTINGLAGNDILIGQGGNDLLVGGTGADILLGLAGSDHYQYEQLNESTLTTIDTIINFEQTEGDRFAINAITINNAYYGGDLSAQANLTTAATTAANYFASNEAVFFHYLGRVHLMVDGGNNTYETANDLMLQVSQFSFKAGDGTATGSLVASDYFV
jgi:hypothetical protein